MKKYSLLFICTVSISMSYAQDNVSQRIIQTGENITFAPLTLLPETEIGNPSKGYYQFDGTTFLSTLPKFEIYKRFSWRDLETQKGFYNFSIIENALNTLSVGQRLSFRVMALNTCCTNFKNGADVPPYIYEEGRGWFYPFHSVFGSDSIFVPDWNDTILIGYMSELLDTIARKYDGDPRIGWFENGLYGNWGEWHTYPLQYPDSSGKYQVPPPSSSYLYAPSIKDPEDTSRQKFRDGNTESKKRILFAHTNRFNKTRLIQSTSDLPILFEALRLERSVPIGIRRDSWGDANFKDITKWNNYQPTEQEWDLFNNRWKVSPFYTENWGGLFAGEETMLDQLDYFHVSALAFGNFGTWSSMSASQQESYLRCGRRAGYRYQITNLSAEITSQIIKVSTSWKNTGIAPCYDKRLILSYLIDPQTETLFSTIDTLNVELSQLSDYNIPAVTETVNISPKPGWESQQILHFRIKIIDPEAYLLPLNLDLQGKNEDGSYTLFTLMSGSINQTQHYELNDKLLLYPNPASTEVSIKLADIGNFIIQITDISGKTISSPVISKNNNIVSLSTENLSNGFYIVNLVSDKRTYTKPFLIYK